MHVVSAETGERRTRLAKGKAAASFPARLTFEAVERSFGERHALQGVSLDIAPGEVIGVLGPSGCGKTTLLRIAAGIERPSAGRVLLDGSEVAGPNRFVLPERRNIGLVFQDFALFPHLSIIDNVAFGLKQLPRADALRIAKSVLERVGLAHLAAGFPTTLSGGEQQRVAIARAIAPRPGVLLLDEPFSGLDVELRAAVQDEMQALFDETGATGMIVTHNPREAMRFGNRIAVLRAGRIVQAGKPEELYRRPGDLLVARLLSEINELPGIVKDGAVDTPFGRFAAEGLAEGAKAVVALRQRQMQVGEPGRGVRAVVVDQAFAGETATLTLAVEGIEERLKAIIANDRGMKTGEEAGLEIVAGGVMVFPEIAPDRSH